MEIAEEDLYVEVRDCLVDCADRYHVRVTHLPTHVVAVSEPQRYRYLAKEEAMADLREKLAAL